MQSSFASFACFAVELHYPGSAVPYIRPITYTADGIRNIGDSPKCLELRRCRRGRVLLRSGCRQVCPRARRPRQHRTTPIETFPETEYRNFQDPFLTCTRPREWVRHTVIRGEEEAILGEKMFEWTGKVQGQRVLLTNPEGPRIEITTVGPLQECGC